MSRLKTFRVLCSIIGIIYLKWERERILYRSDCHPGDHKKKAPWKIQIKPYCKMVWEKYEVLITCCVVPRRRWRAGASVCPWVFPNCLLFCSFWLCHVFIRGTPCCRLLTKLAGKWSSDVVCPLFAHHRLLVQTDFSLRPVPEELCENFDR